MFRTLLLLALACLNQLSDARVTFNHSVVLDEFDFVGQSSVSILGLCADSCRVYASVAPSSHNLGKNILIQTGKGFTSVAALADLRDPFVDAKKQFLEIKNTPSLSIINGNAGLGAGPLVLYVVNQAGAFYGQEVVYEAQGLAVSASRNRYITVMSASPFTISDTSTFPSGLRARLTGFDALDYILDGEDPCPDLYNQKDATFPGFTMNVYAPLISFEYDLMHLNMPAAALDATLGIRPFHTMEEAGFFNSPGYHGCRGKPAYKSSLYDMQRPFEYSLSDNKVEDVSITVMTNSDDAHALIVKDNEGNEAARFHDTGDTQTATAVFHERNLNFFWTPAPETYFVVRYTSTA